MDPAFLFYPNDYLGGTMGMSFEEKGCYIDLLIFQFNNDHFTEAQAKQVLSICFASVWEVLKNKFIKDGEFYFNERLRGEIDKRKAFTESRRINALHPKKPREAYAKHMGNENKLKNELSTFDQFWKVYPKRKSKGQAEKAFVKINPDEQLLTKILESVERAKKSEDWIKENGKYIPHPATWLNAKGWLDESTELHPLAGKVSDKTIQTIETFKKWSPPV
jgi:uncharacterized protein YdaU (DUF1376 family)